MEKIKTSLYCQNCGAEYSKWMGQCASCKEWNTIVEEIKKKRTSENYNNWKGSQNRPKATKLDQINLKDSNTRIITLDNEFNNVIGGGIVPGSVMLLGGEPGIGKSTLLLQIATNIKNTRTIYITGEESASQIKIRSQRLNITTNDCYILTETNIQNIFHHLKEEKPQLVIVDSIQTLTTDSIDSASGSVSQIRECAAELIRFAKETNTPVIIVGHITKDGNIAGPKILEHMVDTVLQFEGDRKHLYRIIRCIKNRYGNASEIAVYEMQSNGLIEVGNPSEVLITKKNEKHSGVVIATTIEGIRPMMVEVQALVSSAVYGTPQRAVTGFDLRRLNMLLAVLEKRCGFKLGTKDVFVNITGGLKVSSTSIDLGVICAILSSNNNKVINNKYCFSAEIGLTGELKPIARINQIINEAEKLGYTNIFVAKHSKVNMKARKIKIKQTSSVSDIYKDLF